MARVRCVVSVLLLLAAIPAVAATKQSSSKPPRDLHRYGDHWTPYNPPDPATFPAGSKVHTIARGDTLWDLARQYYGDPYLWPQLWESNTYITDAHWIYPGDPLLIRGETTTGDVSTSTSAGTVGGEEGGSGTPLAAESVGSSSPVALGTSGDLLCWGYLGHPDEPLPSRVSAYEDTDTKYARRTKGQQLGATEHDIIYIDGGTNTGLVAGQTYLVVKPDILVKHPKSGEVIGRHYDYRGQVRVLCATDTTATAVVTQSCKEMNLGDRLKPLPEIPIPLARMTPMATYCAPTSGKSSGFIVHSKDFKNALGEGQLVEINLGTEEFVAPGDFLTVFRENPMENAPRTVLGEIGVVTAEGHTSTGIVVRMHYDMRVGDRVELK